MAWLAMLGAAWAAEAGATGGLAGLPGDARFSIALYCDPTCDEAVLEGLENDLSRIEDRAELPERVTRPTRIMGLADKTFGIPNADVIAAYGVEVDRPEALAASEQVVIAWFAAPVADAQATLSIAHAAFARAAEKAHGWVEDLDTQQVFGAAAWKARDLSQVEPWFVIDGAPTDPAKPDGDLRLVTRGLRRFGLPDLVVDPIDPALAPDASTVLHAAALGLASRRNATDLDLKTDQIQGVASFSAATRRDDDPEAPLWRLSFDGQITGPADPAGDNAVDSAGDNAGGSADAAPADASAPAPPADLQQAQALALARLASVVLPTFQAGLPPGEVIACSVPFPTRSGGVEYMWVELRSAKGDELTGVLVNEPRDVEGVRKGDTIVFQRQEVFDYIWKRADGSREGNTTAPFLRK